MKTVVLQEHPETGELFFELPLDDLNQMGWSEGDILEWFDNGDGSWSVKKKHDDKTLE
jgi:hypothetical protein